MVKLFSLSFHKIYESLIKIQYFRHEYSSMLYKIRKKRNKIKMHSIKCSHIWYFEISVLIKYTISECLMEVQRFRYEWSSKMNNENTQKKQYNQKVFHNLQLHLACQYTKMCILIRYIPIL